MKRISIMLPLILMLCLCFVLSSCELGDKAITSIKVDPASYQADYELGDSYDFSDLKVIAYYNDGSEKELPYEDLTIGEFSTEVAGTFTVEVTYGEFKTALRLTVVDPNAPSYVISGFEMPDAYVNGFASAKAGNEHNKEAEFMNHANMVYRVGDDNPFIFLPLITAIEDDEPIQINAYKSVNRLFEKVNGEYVELLGDDLAAVVAINDETSSYDFTEAACGRSFRLEVSAYYAPTLPALSLEFEVVDAWNVYSAVDLSRVDNSIQNSAAWADYKYSNGVDNTPINGVVLHVNLSLTKEDLPAAYFYSEADTNNKAIWGTMKDEIDLYCHQNAANQSFGFYGNGCTIDVSAVPTIDESMYGDDCSNTALFKFIGDANQKDDPDVSTSLYMCDVNCIGNGQRTNDLGDLIDDRGGVIFAKYTNENATVQNIIAKSFFIAIFPEWTTVMHLNQSRAYDSLQHTVFVWAGTTVYIDACELKRAGGPLVMMNNNRLHLDHEDYTIYIPTVVISEDSVVESYVNGNEAWFQSMNLGSYISGMKALSDGLQQASAGMVQAGMLTETKTLFGEHGFNLVNVLMSDALAASDVGVQGKITIGDAVAGDMMRDGYHREEGTKFLNASLQTIMSTYAGAAPAFISSANPNVALTTLDGQNFLMYKDGVQVTDQAQFYAELATFFTGEYLALYQSGMCITLSIQNAPAQP